MKFDYLTAFNSKEQSRNHAAVSERTQVPDPFMHCQQECSRSRMSKHQLHLCRTEKRTELPASQHVHNRNCMFESV